MTDIERELSAMRAEVDRMRRRHRQLVGVLGSIVLAGAAAAILAGRPAFSDPASPLACGHASQTYCFAPDSPAQAAQVNSNFEAAFQAIDKKFDKTGGTFTGDVTAPNLTATGNLAFGTTASLAMYPRSNSGSGGGATAVCNQFDLVMGGNVSCANSSAIIGSGTVNWGNTTTWGFYGTCAGGNTATVTAYCMPKFRQ